MLWRSLDPSVWVWISICPQGAYRLSAASPGFPKTPLFFLFCLLIARKYLNQDLQHTHFKNSKNDIWFCRIHATKAYTSITSSAPPPPPQLTNVESDSVELHLAKARVMSKILLWTDGRQKPSHYPDLRLRYWIVKWWCFVLYPSVLNIRKFWEEMEWGDWQCWRLRCLGAWCICSFIHSSLCS